MAVCEVCDAPLSASDERSTSSNGSASSTCERVACRRTAFIRQHRQAERTLRISVLEQATILRDHAAESLGAGNGALFPITITPSLDRALAPLPEARRDAFSRHIEATVAQAIARGPSNAPVRDPRDEASLEPPSPSLGVVLGAACGTCRGFCCTKGGDRAFLAVETLQRYLLAHPAHDEASVVASYVAHLPPETIDASCVFHGARGCTLTREMRSDTCNRYYCGALHELQRAVPDDAIPRAFVVAADGNTITSAAFLDPSEQIVALEMRGKSN
jgi:hypothetical protein